MLKFFSFCFYSCVAALACSQLEAQTSQWVEYGQSGLLQYQMDSRGDRLMDFSSAGYRNGEAIPDALSVIESNRIVNVNAETGDDRQRIQDAIDQVSSMSLNANGFRGIVNLSAGEYQLATTLNINASGVVLKGVGDGASAADSTILRSTATTAIDIINVNSPNHNFHGLNASGRRVSISDKVVPTGATSFNVTDSSQFSVGDEVVVFRQASQQWIDSLGTAANWDASDSRYNQIQERKITRIEGSRVFFDAPIAHNIDSRQVSGEIYRYTDNRIRNVGIEGIRGVATIDANETAVVNGQTVFTDEDHAENFINFSRVRDAWAQDVTGQHLGLSTVIVNGVSRSITVANAESVAPASEVTGGRRYAFNANGGQFLLFRDLQSDQGRHDFITNSTFNGFNRGPNVFLNSTATNDFSNSGAHQNYATGTLLDNIVTQNQINVRDRGTNADHGWEGANFVIWNSESDSFRVHNPPGSRNYLIGVTGTINDTGGTGTYDSLGQRINFNDPENPLNSLFVAQTLQLQRFSEIEHREYWVGDFDQLENDGAADQVAVDAQWLVDIENISQFVSDQQTIGFDEVQFGTKVPFTINFELGEDESVFAAFLTIGMNRNGGDSSDNDLLFLDNTSSPLTFAPGQWGYQEDGETLQVLTLELLGDLDYLQDGQLNGLLTNNRAIDWVHLSVFVGSVNAVPEPSSVVIVVAFALASFTRRKKS